MKSYKTRINFKRNFKRSLLSFSIFLALGNYAYAETITCDESTCNKTDINGKSSIGSNTPTGNIINISKDGYADVYGGFSENDSVTNNTVNITKGTSGWNGNIYGGFSKNNNVSNNKVNITGKNNTAVKLTEIYGGYSDKGIVSGNTVILDADTIPYPEKIVGGESKEGTAENNTITIKSPFIGSSYVNLIGSLDKRQGEVISGIMKQPNRNSTLNIQAVGVKVKGVRNFNNYNFFIPTGTENGATLLNVATSVDMTDAKIGVAIQGENGDFITDDYSVKLIESQGTLKTDSNLTDSKEKIAVESGMLEYDFLLEKDGNALVAKYNANAQVENPNTSGNQNTDTSQNPSTDSNTDNTNQTSTGTDTTATGGSETSTTTPTTDGSDTSTTSPTTGGSDTSTTTPTTGGATNTGNTSNQGQSTSNSGNANNQNQGSANTGNTNSQGQGTSSTGTNSNQGQSTSNTGNTSNQNQGSANTGNTNSQGQGTSSTGTTSNQGQSTSNTGNTSNQNQGSANTGNTNSQGQGTSSTGTTSNQGQSTSNTGNTSNQNQGSANTGNTNSQGQGTSSTGTTSNQGQSTSNSGNANNQGQSTSNSGNANNQGQSTSNTGNTSNQNQGSSNTGNTNNQGQGSANTGNTSNQNQGSANTGTASNQGQGASNTTPTTPPKPRANPRTTSFLATSLANLEFINRGVDLADNLLSNNFIDQQCYNHHKGQPLNCGLKPFAAINAGTWHYKDKRSSEVKGTNMLVGFGGAAYHTAYGVFAEFGTGKYEDEKEKGNKVKTDGDTQYYGVGVMVRKDFNQAYVKGSAHLGQSKTKYNSDNSVLIDGSRHLRFNTERLYTALTLGAGYQFDINDNFVVTPFVNLAYLHTGSDKFKVKGREVKLATADSLRTQVGFKVNYQVEQQANTYMSVAFETEHKAKAKGTVLDRDIPTDSMKGTSTVIDTGVKFKLSHHLNMTTGVKGSFGYRKGVSGNLSLNYKF